MQGLRAAPRHLPKGLFVFRDGGALQNDQGIRVAGDETEMFHAGLP